MKSNLMMKLTLMILMFMMTTMNNWISMWMHTEMISILTIMGLNSKQMNKDSELLMKMMMFQSLTTMILMVMIIKFNSMNIKSYIFQTQMMTIMIAKMGLYPIHMMNLLMTKSKDWMNLFHLNLTLKIPALVMMNSLMNKNLMKMMILMIIIPIMNWNMNNMKINLSLMSINNMYWFILIMMMNSNMMMLFFFIYYINNMFLMNIMKKKKINLTIQMIKLKYKLKMSLIFSIINLMGMPPFSMFLLKWISINLMKLNPMMMTILILTNIIMSLVYTKIILVIYSNNNLENKWNLMNNHKYKKMTKWMNKVNLMSIILMI